jgi:uncharacterized protein YdhG (YjbR/CyaY superfamily)
MEKMTVDDFVELRVMPEFHPVVEMIRDLMKECAPQAKEIISYGYPAYQTQRIVAVISPNKKDITFSFSRGALFQDRYGLLRGAGISSRHVKIKSLARANQEALRYYIQQALEWDAR